MLTPEATVPGRSTRSCAPYSTLCTVIHRKEKVAKRKEDRPMTDLFLSSNGYGNDYLKSGPRWSEQPGPPHYFDCLEAGEDLIDHPMLDIDSARISAR